jgi:hypothetical protein
MVPSNHSDLPLIFRPSPPHHLDSKQRHSNQRNPRNHQRPTATPQPAEPWSPAHPPHNHHHHHHTIKGLHHPNPHGSSGLPHCSEATHPPLYHHQNHALRIISINSPTKSYLSSILENLPPAEIIMLNEIGRTQAQIIDAITPQGWTLVVTAERCEPKPTCRSAILIRSNLPHQVEVRGSNATACYADITLPTAATPLSHPLRVMTLYAPNHENTPEMEQMSMWCSHLLRSHPGQVLLAGDFNPRTNRVVEGHFTSDPYLQELVKGRSTFRRASSRTSIDRVYTRRDSTLFALPTLRWIAGADHAALCIEAMAMEESPIPPMRRLKPYGLHLAEVERFDECLDSLPTKPRHTRKPTHIKRLEAAAADRLQARWEAQRAHDDPKINQLNAEIKNIREKLDLCARGDHVDPIRPNKIPYAPPMIDNPEATLTHFYKRMAATLHRDTFSFPQGQVETISPVDVRRAIERLRRKRGSRQIDLPVSVLDEVNDDDIKFLCSLFNDWIMHGIPPRFATSWIFLTRKSNKSTGPTAFRPIAIMTLYTKLLHTSIYTRLKEKAYKVIRDQRFQLSTVNPQAIMEIIETTQSLLEKSSDDDEIAVLMSDIEAAYDSVPHGPLVTMIRNNFGQRWANSIQQVLASQSISFAVHNGFSDSVYMGRGLTQGSSLSVLLFLLYTCDGPTLPNALYSRAYVDDITVVTRREDIVNTWTTILQWSKDKGLELARAKTSIVTKNPMTIELPCDDKPLKISSTTAGRLLGACLHATKVSTCPRNNAIVESCCRITDAIRASIYIPTRKKALLFKQYALSKMSIQALSRCCSPNDAKLNAARLSLIPHHDSSRGVVPAEFATSSRGFNLPAPATYINTRKSHARVVAQGFDNVNCLPAKDFEVLHTTPKKTVPKQIKMVVDEVKRALRSGDVIAATDGGYDPETDVGTIGLSINGKRMGMVIEGTCSSSTQPEIIAQLTLRVATKLAGDVPHDVKWTGYTDSQSSLTRYKRRHLGDPVSDALGCTTCPQPQWARGHADNAAINNADEGATAARNQVQACKTCKKGLRCNRCPRISVKTLYSLAGVKSYCVYKPTETIQMDTLTQFMKTSIQSRANGVVRAKLKDWAPPASMDGKLLGRLSRIAGAVDLLQALVRRAIHPLRTTELCTVRGCNHPLTVEHILLAGDANHLNHIGCPPEESDTFRLFPRTLKNNPKKTLTASVKHIMEAYAHGDCAIMKLVATRVQSLTTDSLAKRWATWLLSYLRKPQI